MIDPVSSILHDRAGHHGPVVLMYHSVVPGKGSPAWPWAVSMERFRSQLDFLRDHGWRTVTLQNLVKGSTTNSPRTIVITFDDGYADNFLAYEELVRRDMVASWFVVTGSIGNMPKWRDQGQPNETVLNVDQLKIMGQTGMEIGSHTASHLRLPKLDDQSLAAELNYSKTTLEDLLGHEISGFAYPYGAWDARCAQAVRQAGYRYACTTQSGWALRDNVYQIRRLTVYNRDTTSMLARKLYFGNNEAPWHMAAQHLTRRLWSRITP